MESGLDLLRKIASGELPPAPIRTTLGLSLGEVGEGPPPG